MVDYVARSKLVSDVVKRDAHFYHKHHNVINEVGYFVYRLCFIVSLACDDYLGAFLTDFFEDLINSLFKKVGGVRAFLLLKLSALDDLHKSFKRKLGSLALINGIIEAGIRAEMAGGTVLIYNYRERILVAICGDAYDMLTIPRSCSLSPKLLS